MIGLLFILGLCPADHRPMGDVSRKLRASLSREPGG